MTLWFFLENRLFNDFMIFHLFKVVCLLENNHFLRLNSFLLNLLYLNLSFFFFFLFFNIDFLLNILFLHVFIIIFFFFVLQLFNLDFLNTLLVQFPDTFSQLFTIEIRVWTIPINSLGLINIPCNKLLKEVNIPSEQIIGRPQSPNIVPYKFRFSTKFQQFLQRNDTEVLCPSVVDKKRLKKTRTAFNINSRVELINPVL